ncbi:MAG: hypothetical protein RLZZ324_484 [Candidatus Parcubacteria bacterium]|jgi:phosphatidylinositol alpha-1,6-mannosyltransferase
MQTQNAARQKGPVLIATLEYPPQHGGIATYLASLAHMLPVGSVQVLAPESEHARSHDAAEDMPIFRRPLLSRWLRPRWIAALISTAAVVTREKPSVLVVSHLLPMGTVARILKRLCKLPYVVIVHGMDVALALEAGGRKLKAAHAALAEADLVVANSEYTARLAESAGATKRKLMVVNPAPTFALGAGDFTLMRDARTREDLGLHKGFLALSVGRLVERKGFDTLIAAVGILKKHGKAPQLVIVGDGPDRKRLEELAYKEDVLEDVRFLGSVPFSELAAIHAAADCFVLAPRTIGADVEGFGIVYLDAALMGKPSVGTRAGGIPEAVKDGETGILVPPADAPALADALRKIMDDPSYAARLGIQGRARVKRDFDPVALFAPLVDFLSRYHG